MDSPISVIQANLVRGAHRGEGTHNFPSPTYIVVPVRR